MLIYSLHAKCQNSDMFRSVLIIFRELLNINEAYTYKTLIIKYINICTYYTLWANFNVFDNPCLFICFNDIQ